MIKKNVVKLYAFVNILCVVQFNRMSKQITHNAGIITMSLKHQRRQRNNRKIMIY